MFTGIVTDIGCVRGIEQRDNRDLRIVIATAYDSTSIDIGASVACAGACLTVVDKGQDAGQDWLAFDVSAESLSKTTIGTWAEGTRVNLERPLKVGDELGGHIVSGHVDGIAEVLETRDEGGSLRVEISLPDDLARFVCAKGSVSLDGVSLTVNGVGDLNGVGRFDVNIVPHTQEQTTFGEVKPGSKLNMEIDTLARYLARLSEVGN